MNAKKIKVLYILPSLASGGAERFLLDLIYSLNLSVFEPQLLLFKDSGFFYPEAIGRGLKIKVLSKKFKFDLINFYHIYKYIKKEQPDIVHTELGGDIYGKLVAKLAGVKIIVSTEQNVSINDRQIIYRLKKITTGWSDKIIAISSAVRDDLIKKYQVAPDKIELFFNGLDVEKFKQVDQIEKDQSERQEFDTIIIGSVGRLSPQKNFSLLFQALSRVKEKNFKCLIAGEGELRLQLEQEIKDLGLNDKIELVGLKVDIKSFLADLDFFVLPSKWEGLGIVLLEAGVTKLPVLASATGGILDIIEDQKNGLLFNNENLDDLIIKLNYCLDYNNQTKLKQLGENLFLTIIEKFDIKKITSQYQNMYQELLKNKHENITS